jgi:protein-L-isoaspartate(D-aspartate) O-methyltransferase
MSNLFDRGKKRMIADIQREVQYTRTMTGKDALDERVIQAMKEVPRDAFVPNGMKMRAFDNGPLPIGHGQTISQPYIVALMTDLLEIEAVDTVLEIGTGSGYQTAILSRLCKQVYSLEIIPELSASAGRLLEQLGYDNIEMRSGNGFEGWPDNGPYDGIIVTAAAPYIPDTLFDQLKPGGRLVIPVGLPYRRQELIVVTKDERGEMQTEAILGVAFVPMVDSRLDVPRNNDV